MTFTQRVICSLEEYKEKHKDDFLYMVNLPYEEIFAGNYDFILCDLGIYGGYNIQTKLIIITIFHF